MPRYFSKEKVYLCALLFLLLLVIPSVTLLGILTFPYFFFGKKYSFDRITRNCVWWYGKSYVFLTQPFAPATRSWEGDQEFVLPKGSVVIMNHYSVLDLYYLGLMPTAKDGNIAFVTQKRPSLVKLYAPFMKAAQYIDMRQEDLKSCEALCAAHLEKGNHILFFPEGGRNRETALGKFKSTPFYIANKYKAPIVPICVYGTNHLIPPNVAGIYPTNIDFHIMQPIITSDMDDELGHRILKKKVHAKMAKCLNAFHVIHSEKL